jgi:hypothetical protein
MKTGNDIYRIRPDRRYWVIEEYTAEEIWGPMFQDFPFGSKQEAKDVLYRLMAIEDTDD